MSSLGPDDVEKPQAVERVGWGRWLQEHGAPLLMFARQQTRNAHDAEDVFQEALVKLARKVEEGSFVGGMEAWKTYLYTQIRREAIDRGRSHDRRVRREQQVAEDAFGLNSSEDGALFFGEEKEQAELVAAALRRLPSKQSEVVVMKIWGGQTFDQIGEVLGVSLNTAASRYRYGLEGLRNLLAESRKRGDI